MSSTKWHQLLPKQQEEKPALRPTGSYDINACDGTETIVSATDVFYLPDESRLRWWNLNAVSPRTCSTKAGTYDIRTYFDELQNYLARTKDVLLTQAQAVYFCRKYRTCFPRRNSTFIPFMLRRKCVLVRIDDGADFLRGKLGFHLFPFWINVYSPVPTACQIVLLNTDKSVSMLHPLLQS